MALTLASVFEFLFKYRPVVFEKGIFSLAAPGVAFVVALAAVMVGALALRTYGGVAARTSRRDRVVLAALRGAAILVLAVLLLRPSLVVSAVVPQRNVLAVMLDDSRSMRLADEDGRPRADVVRRLFGGPDSALYAQLARQFTLRVFRFSHAAHRVAGADSMAFDGTRTQVDAGLRQISDELAGTPLAGIVLVSDGADNADSALAGALLGGGRRVPVFTVGVGREQLSRDVQLSQVDAPRSALVGSTVALDVALSHTGYAGQTVQLVAEDGGRVVASQPVRLPRDEGTARVRLLVPVTEAGARALRVRVAAQPGETITANNGREVLVTVRDGRERILYVEGEPRFELKFLRRAVADDPNLQVVTLLRSADGKFLRLGVNDSTELRDGFPTSRAELFGYRAVILGSVEASFFSLEQLRMLTEFVGERGGGLLALGGPLAFAEGGYAGTPLAEVLPVELGAAREAPESTPLATLRVTPTAAGRAHAALQLAGTTDSSAARWAALPPLTSVNRVRGVKPGASVLLSGRVESAGAAASPGTTTGATTGASARPAAGAQPTDEAERVVLTMQRYGRGVAMALPVQDSWLWQMHADIPLADQTHERFWRQMLRWLVSEVPERVTVAAEADQVEAGAPLRLRAEVRDSAWHMASDAEVRVRVQAPSGEVQEVPLAWTGERDGEYRAAVTPTERGTYVLTASARRGDETLEAGTGYARVAESDAEAFDAGMRAPMLRRLAEETGGRFYTAATVAALPRDVIYTESGTTVPERKDLWDMPAVLLLLVGLLGAEWGYRRMRGVA
jgi:hypothetical protein